MPAPARPAPPASLKVVSDHGTEHGLDWAANAIQRGANGRYFVADPAMRQQILDLRKHPETASVMAAEFASDNRAFLEQQLGRPTEAVDLYLAHFLGAGGAAKFLAAADANPGGSAAALFPAAAQSNRPVFFDGQGNARSFAEIRANFARKLDHGARNAGAGAPSGSDYEGNAQVQPADYVRIEQARLAQSQSLNEATAYPEFQPQTAAARLAYLTLETFGR
jgi:hypothetical protein